MKCISCQYRIIFNFFVLFFEIYDRITFQFIYILKCSRFYWKIGVNCLNWKNLIKQKSLNALKMSDVSMSKNIIWSEMQTVDIVVCCFFNTEIAGNCLFWMVSVSKNPLMRENVDQMSNKKKMLRWKKNPIYYLQKTTSIDLLGFVLVCRQVHRSIHIIFDEFIY